eukprot:g9183.t1
MAFHSRKPRPCGLADDPDELSQVLQLHGAAPARSSLAGLPSGPGYLRQPLTEELRRPRSATDRGTESQRKALERLRAAQAKHDEECVKLAKTCGAAAAADEQRRKVLPLIRWRDSATAAAQQGTEVLAGAVALVISLCRALTVPHLSR